MGGHVLVPPVVEEGVHDLALHVLAVEQHVRHGVHLGPAGLEHAARAIVGLAHDALDLVVDALGGLGGVVVVVGVVAPEEDLVLRLAEDLGAQLLAHAEARDHLARDLGRALEVVARTGGDVGAEQLLGRAAAQQHRDLVEHAVSGLQEVVLLGQLHGVAQRPAARDDRDLVHGVGVLQDVAHQGVAGLVVGDGDALLVCHYAALLLGAGDDALHGLLHLVHADPVLVAPGGEQGGLVHEVCEVRAGEAGGELGDALEVHLGRDGLVLAVDRQDPLATLHVGAVDRHLAVEAARAQQRGVEDVGAVGRGDEDDGGVVLEAVHLHEQLVQGLLALVVAAAEAGAPLAADGVDLVDEDDRGGGLLGLLEEVAHAARADADEHLDEVGSGDGEERDARLAGDRLGEQRLARARRAHEQHAAGDLGAHLEVTLGLAQEVPDLLELLDRLVDARDVRELDLGAGLLGRLGLGLTELHGAPVLALDLVHEVDEDREQQQGGHDREEDGLPEAVVGGVHHEADALVALHQLVEVVHPGVGALELRRRVVGAVRVRAVVGAREGAVGGVVGDVGHALVAHRRHEVAGGKRVHLLGGERGRHGVHEVAGEDRHEDPVDHAQAPAARGRVVQVAVMVWQGSLPHMSAGRVGPAAAGAATSVT